MGCGHSLRTSAALILALAGACLAQQYSFRHYSAGERLQNLTVLPLAPDGAGFVWAGSEGGLYRYDGTRFRLMSAAEGLACSTEVHALGQYLLAGFPFRRATRIIGTALRCDRPIYQTKRS